MSCNCSKTLWFSVCLHCRNEDWSADSKNGPSEGEEPYAGPPGMDPDGIIESNWEVVSILLHLYHIVEDVGWLVCLLHDVAPSGAVGQSHCRVEKGGVRLRTQR